MKRRAELGEFPEWQRRLGLYVPMFSPDGITRGCQIRPDRPRKDGLKYESPHKSDVIIDVHPRMIEEVRHGGGDLWIVEGVKKADALASRGIAAVALSGVWMAHVKGSKGKALLPCWDHVRLSGRRAIVAFDSDWQRKVEVHDALQRAVKGLEERGADVRVCYLEDAPDGSKVGVDDYLVAGGTVAGLMALCRKFERQDVARIRLSRDQKLRADVGYLWRQWHDGDWMRFVGAAERGNWQRGHTARDAMEALIKLAASSGKPDGRGVVVRVGLRRLAELAAKSAQSMKHAVKHLEADGQLEILLPEDRSKARRYRLLVPARTLDSMGMGHSEETALEESVRGCKGCAPPTAPRLRWSSPGRKAQRLRGVTPGTSRVRETRRFSKMLAAADLEDRPYVKRMAPHRGAILDALEAAGGELSYEGLCEALHRRAGRWRDFRRRILRPLEDAGIIECEGQIIGLVADWRDRLEEERERTGEIARAEEQREEHRKASDRYRGYLESLRRLPSRAGRDAVERGREKGREHRRENLIGWVERTTRAPLSPLAVAVRAYLDRNPHQARQPAGWLGVTLWAEGLHPKLEDPPAETRAAIEELGGVAYLDGKVKQAKGAA